MRRIASLVALALAAGCASQASYPPAAGQRGADVFQSPCPEIMASALAYAHTQIAPGTPMVWNLPPGTDPLVWGKVERDLPAGSRRMSPGDASVWSMEKLRLDGSKAQVDVVYRTPEGIWQAVTVHFEGAFGAPFHPVYLQRWMVPASAPVCGTPAAG